jgi:preprotein translocase subunit SecY
MFILVVAGVIYVTEAERPIPITYAKQSRIGDTGGSLGVSTYLPLRLNQAGVVPIIFALSMLLLPQFASQLMTASSNPTIALYGSKIAQIIANQWIYGGVYFALIIFFTYFYTLITFDPAKTAERLQKDGAFIPGFRPGVATVEYVSGVLSRIIIVGALFLGVIAVLPIVVQNLTGITSITLGGTSLLIVISVVLDVVKKVDAQLSMREY